MSSSQSKPAPVVLETGVPFSRSLLWQRLRDLYIQRGAKAWSEDRIPNFITNNPFFADIYARIVAAFAADGAGVSSDQPLHILEIGGGVGKFAFLFLRHLEEQLSARGAALENIHYTLADCSPALVEALRNHPYLGEFARRGILEFALGCDALPPEWLQRSHSSPRVLIANYVFDSLPHDAFRIKAGETSELLLTTSATEDAAPVSRLQLDFHAAPAASPRYADAICNQILEQYRADGLEATVLFPAGPLQLLQPLFAAGGPLLVLAADKGFTRQDTLAFSQGPAALEFHSENYFSLMANFDALAKYFRARHGEALLPEKYFSSFSICAFLHGGGAGGFPRTQMAYAESQHAFGPDDLFTLMAGLNQYLDGMAPPQILAILRLTRWDPMAFVRLFPALARQLGSIGTERQDFRTAVQRVWANHFPLSAAENELAFDCGVVLLGLGFPDDALPLFEISQQTYGPSATTSYNLALCCQGVGRSADALAHAQQACRLDPKFDPAQALLQKLTSA
jgi:hypothetical protein